MADSSKVAAALLEVRKRIDRCLDSETANRQIALEDVDVMLAALCVAVAVGEL